MGFRNGAYAKVWEVQPKTPNVTSVKLSISMKSRETGDYETKFSEYVSFLGAQCAGKAATLKPGDRIKLGDVDAETKWVSQEQKKYYSWKVFSFDIEPQGNPTYPQNPAQNYNRQPQNTAAAPANPVYEGNVADDGGEGLPF